MTGLKKRSHVTTSGFHLQNRFRKIMLQAGEEQIYVATPSPIQPLMTSSSYHPTKWHLFIVIFLISHFSLLTSVVSKLSYIVDSKRNFTVTSCQLCHNWRMKMSFDFTCPAYYCQMFQYSEVGRLNECQRKNLGNISCLYNNATYMLYFDR